MGMTDRAPSLSLDCLTLPDVAPVDLVRIAADVGYGSFSLWVQPPAMYDVMLVTTGMTADLARVIADLPVSLGNLEVFNLNTDEPIAGYEPAIALGAHLGATTATAIDFGAPRADIAERFSAFHALCADHGILALVEPIIMGNVRTPQDGLNLIRTAGVDAKLVIDCLHLVRAGCTADALLAIPPEYVGHVQICDGPSVIDPDELGFESTANRLYPGEGAFPLAEILAAIPPGATLGLEVPNVGRLERGVPPAHRAREAMSAARAVLDRVEPRTQ
jgi:sugar phosphate isomerase/epimerase